MRDNPHLPQKNKGSTSARFQPLSTDPATDLAALVHDALFGWLAADGHMHLKNLGLLRIAAPDATAFTSSHVAPPDDAVTTHPSRVRQRPGGAQAKWQG
jgi:hypothetical protein